MNKNESNKFVSFIRKEGFYLLLFVCLCILGTVAFITSKNIKEAKKIQAEQTKVVQNKKKDVAKADEKPYKEYNNALQVKGKNKKEEKVIKKDTTQVSKNTEVKFIKPVQGMIARKYSDVPVFWKSTNSYRPNFGMDIKCEIGKPVVAVMTGKVENVESDTVDGVKVTVNHQNGLKTVYSNLDPKVSVKKGQDVKMGSKLGNVGRTTVRAAYETYGEHLHFAVLKDGKFVNPSRYLKY